MYTSGFQLFFQIMFYLAAIVMTMSDLQGYSPIANHYKWDFSYCHAAADKTSIGIMCWKLSFFNNNLHSIRMENVKAVFLQQGSLN